MELTLAPFSKFKTAVQDDLFGQLNTVAKSNNKIPSDLTMKHIMDTWTVQPGFPLLRVSVADATGVFVSQVKYFNSNSRYNFTT